MPDVRESAIDIIVDHPAIAALPYWREAAPAGIPPHVTLLYPWRTPPVDEASLVALRDAIRGTAPFSITLDGIDTFPQGVVYASIADHDGLRKLMRSIAARFPDTPPYGGRFGSEAVPHLTLAQVEPAALAATTSAVGAALEGLLPLMIGVTSVSAFEQSDDGMWAVTVTVPLGG